MLVPFIYRMANLPNGTSNRTTFDIEDDGAGNAWLLGWTKDQNPKVSYSVAAPPAPTTSMSVSEWVSSATGSATGATQRPSSGVERMEDSWAVVVSVVFSMLRLVEMV